MASKEQILKELARRELQKRKSSNFQSADFPISQQGLIGRTLGPGASAAIQSVGREVGVPVVRGLNTAAFGLPVAISPEKEQFQRLQPETGAGEKLNTASQLAGLFLGGSARTANLVARGGKTIPRQFARGGASFGATQIFDPQESIGQQIGRQAIQSAQFGATGAALGLVARPIFNIFSQINRANQLSKSEGISRGSAFKTVREADKFSRSVAKQNKFQPIAEKLAASTDEISVKVKTQETELRRMVGDALLSPDETIKLKSILRKVPTSVKTNLKKQDLALIKSLTQKGKSPKQIKISDAFRIKTNIGDQAFKNIKAMERGQEVINLFDDAASIARDAAARELAVRGVFQSKHSAMAALKQADARLTEFYRAREPVLKILYERGDPTKRLTPDSLRSQLKKEGGRTALENFYSKFGNSAAEYLNQGEKILRFEKNLQRAKGIGKFVILEELIRRNLNRIPRGGE